MKKLYDKVSDIIKDTEIKMRRNGFIKEFNSGKLIWRTNNKRIWNIYYLPDDGAPLKLIDTKIEVRMEQIENIVELVKQGLVSISSFRDFEAKLDGTKLHLDELLVE